MLYTLNNVLCQMYSIQKWVLRLSKKYWRPEESKMIKQSQAKKTADFYGLVQRKKQLDIIIPIQACQTNGACGPLATSLTCLVESESQNKPWLWKLESSRDTETHILLGVEAGQPMGPMLVGPQAEFKNSSMYASLRVKNDMPLSCFCEF